MAKRLAVTRWASGTGWHPGRWRAKPQTSL